MVSRPVRAVLGALSYACFGIAFLLVVRVVLRYFGALAGSDASELVVAVSRLFVVPLGLPSAHSLYGGVFDTDAAVTIAIALVLEWVLVVARGPD